MLDFLTSLTSTHLFLFVTGILTAIIHFLWKSNSDLHEKNAVAEDEKHEIVQNITALQTQALSTINDLKKQDEIDANTPITPDATLEWLHATSQPNYHNNTESDGQNRASISLPYPTSDC